MKVGIVGGGITGLALAQRLSARGHAVTVLERAPQLGGLATYENYGPFVWDRFYHVILPTDSFLIDFLRDIGLEQALRWHRTLTGFFVNRQLYSVSSTWEFLRFPAVSLIGKFRLALTMLYCARINNWRKLEEKPLEPWLIRLSGRTTYEKFWKPLLLAKLGENYRRVSAVFIWTYIKRMYSAKDSAARKEQLGYVSGGYKTIIDRVAESITAAGGRLVTGVTVKRITPDQEGGVTIESDAGPEHFDKVVFTGPVNILERVAPTDLIAVDRPDGVVEYLGVICLVLVTRKPLVPFYIVNIADDRIPFTGIIGMTGVVDTSETAGLHLAYLPKYVHSDDPVLREDDSVLREQFLDGLRLMLPGFSTDDIVSVHVHRAIKVQPIQVINYSRFVPKVRTRSPDFAVLNSSQFVSNTLNNNEAIRNVDAFMDEHYETFFGTQPEDRNVGIKPVSSRRAGI